MRIAHMAALSVLVAPAAQVQQAGTYTGTNSQGQPFFRTPQLPPKRGCAYSPGKQTVTATLGAPVAR